MNGRDQEYAIGAPEHVILSRALERILRARVEEECEETGEGRYPWKPARGRVVNEEERDLDEGVERKRKPLHRWACVGKDSQVEVGEGVSISHQHFRRLNLKTVRLSNLDDAVA